jgi:hypothetical protein
MNGNLNNNIEKVMWIFLTKLNNESELLNANWKFTFWYTSEDTHAPR